MRKAIIFMVLCLCIMAGCTQANEQSSLPPSSSSEESVPQTKLESDIEAFLEFIRKDLETLEYSSYLYIDELSPEYSFCKYDNRTSTGAFALLNKQTGFVTEIKNQVFEFYHTDFVNASYDEREKIITFINYSGSRLFRPTDFPHCLEYSIEEDTVTKTYLSLSSWTSAYCVGFHPNAIGSIGTVDRVGNRVQITFNIDAVALKLNTDNYFPQIELIYDATSSLVTISFLNMESKSNALYEELQKLEGVGEIAVSNTNTSPKSTQVSFKLQEGYKLYGEVVSENLYMDTDHLALWTEKKV